MRQPPTRTGGGLPRINGNMSSLTNSIYTNGIKVKYLEAKNEREKIHKCDVCGVADAVDDDYTDRAAGG